MATVDQYVRAATRENTRQSYRAAVRHFEEDWGGLLPASANAIAQYLAAHADSHALSTLRQRLAALAQWHQAQGFPDPTKAPLVRQVLRGIRQLHPSREKQAKPLQVELLGKLDAWLQEQIDQAAECDDLARLRRHTRDRALILLGFWRGFRSDELCRLRVEDIEVQPSEGLRIHLRQTKTTRGWNGVEFQVPVLDRLCPVRAYQAWISLAHLDDGPVFRRIRHNGDVGEAPLHSDSIVPILRRSFADADLPAPDSYSGHSLRRGFATWANANGWDIHALMNYVGWRDMASAMRYIDQRHPFSRRISSEPPPAGLTQEDPTFELYLSLEPYQPRGAKPALARRHLEALCLRPYPFEPIEGSANRYRITIPRQSDEDLEEEIYELIAALHAAGKDSAYFVDVRVSDPTRSGKVWE